MVMPTPSNSVSKLENLWDKAVDNLTERDRRLIDFSQDDKRTALEKLLGLVEKDQKDDIRGQLTIPRKLGKPVVLRDVFGKLANCIHKFREVGDNVVQYDPAHAALPWAAVRFLLQAVVSEHEIRTSMLDGLERVADLIAHFAWVETLYLRASTTKRVNLQDALVKLYVAILTYLIKARRYYAKHTHERILKSLVQTEEQSVQKYLRTIADEENKVNKIARLIDAQYLREISKTMNGGFTGLIGRSNEISQHIQNLQLSLDMRHREPDVSRDDLLKWINARPTHDDYHVALKARVKNTCSWVLDRPNVQAWLAASKAGSQVLWIHGKPGSGKTILSASLVEYLKKRKSAPVCYFFCFYNHEGKRLCNNIVGSWVSQLVRNSTIAFEIAKESYKKKESHTAGQVELWQIFQTASVQLQECYFVIDGFDECVRDDVSERNFSHLDTRALFLQQLDDAISNSQARVLFVSREDSDFRERLRISRDRNAAGTNWTVWTEYEITRNDTAEDIERFSREILEYKLSRSRATAELKEELATDAAEKSEGMFLWIKLIYARLPRSNNPSKLHDIISSTPSGLDQAYERDLKAILSFPEEDQIRAIAILRWTLFAKRPLTVRELCEALIVERDLGDDYKESDTDSLRFDDGLLDQADIPEIWDDTFIEDQILRLCGSLIVVRGGDADQPIENHAIYFVHFSVKEYLLKVEPFVSTSRAHTRIAISCLKYLCYDDFNQEQNSTLEEFDHKMNKYAFLSYAGSHGLDHLDDCSPTSPALVQWCNHLLDPKEYKWLSLSEVLCDKEFKCYESYLTEHPDNYHSPLYLASWHGQNETIQLLLRKGEDVNQLRGYYGCPLSAAAAHGHDDAIKLLLASGANPNQSGGEFGNPLQSAAAMGHEPIVTTLLASGASVNQIGGDWHAAIIAASQVPDPKISKAIVCRLLQARADVKVTSHDGTTALHEASYVGSTETIRCLIEKGAEIDARTDDGITPLYFACYNSNEEAIRALIDKGANVNVVNKVGRSSLHVLAGSGNDAMVELLLDHGADVKAKRNDGETALHNAARWGHVSTIEILSRYGADVGVKNEEGHESLHFAAHQGHTKAVACLLNLGANVSSMDDKGWTALHCAAYGGHEDVIKFLLANASDINAVDLDGSTALHNAAVRGHEEVIKCLLANGSDIKAVDSNGLTALHWAASEGHEDVIKFLLANGSDIAAVNSNGQTALHWAAMEGHENVIKLLLANGSDINAVNSKDRTALHCAALKGHEDVIKLLLANGSDINAVDSKGRTALHNAAIRGHEDVIKLLFANGRDINAVLLDGSTALHLAAYHGHEKLIETLLSKGIDIEAVDARGCTALHTAVLGQNLAAVNVLLQHGANPQAKSANELTALHCAAFEGDEKIVESLVSKGVDIEAVDADGYTALHDAVGRQKLAAVNVLLQHGASLQAQNSDGKTPLDLAREYGKDENQDDAEDDEREADDDEDDEDNEDGDHDGDAGDNEEEVDDDDVLKQKIISLLENWNKLEQQTAA